FERPRARPVQVGAFLEDDVDVRGAEVRYAAHRFHARRADERGDDRRGDLCVDDVGAAIPARVDDHLRVAEIGYRVERHAAHRPPAGGSGGDGDENDGRAVAGRPVDDAIDHGSGGAAPGSCRMRLSESSRNAPAVTTRSPAARPRTISTRSPNLQPIRTSRGSNAPSARSTNTRAASPPST